MSDLDPFDPERFNVTPEQLAKERLKIRPDGPGICIITGCHDRTDLFCQIYCTQHMEDYIEVFGGTPEEVENRKIEAQISEEEAYVEVLADERAADERAQKFLDDQVAENQESGGYD